MAEDVREYLTSRAQVKVNMKVIQSQGIIDRSPGNIKDISPWIGTFAAS